MSSVSWASSEGAARSMRANRGRDTTLELNIRRRLHAAGYRYRVDYAPISGTRRRADIVFTRLRVAVFVDGCFWHGCPIDYTAPRSNADFWRAKLDSNRARDLDTNARLAETGWVVLRFWEHDTLNEMFDSIKDSLEHLQSIQS